jgi:arginine N-succinyltransferase
VVLLIRDARPSDLPRLARLARVLDTVNLPHDPIALAAIVDESARSFSGRIRDPLARRYVFVGELGRQVVGTSMIVAQHGTRESPCTFFDVSEREHYSSTLDRHFRHVVLSLGFHYDGPTEIGGLVVLPSERGGPLHPGKQLAFVRFLYLAMHRERFRDTVLAELMPDLGPGGKSRFWEAFGRRFTDLDYRTADRLSRENKEFIQQLFPPVDVYATVFPPSVRRRLGAVGHATVPVRRLLSAIGFRSVSRIDPFDGGPHYEAKLEEITLVRAHRAGRVSPEPLSGHGTDSLVAVEPRGGPDRFRAVRCPVRHGRDGVRIPAKARRLLGVEAGERVDLVPF